MAARKTPNADPKFVVNPDFTGFKPCIKCGRRSKKFDKCSGCRDNEQRYEKSQAKKEAKKAEPKLEEIHR